MRRSYCIEAALRFTSICPFPWKTHPVPRLRGAGSALNGFGPSSEMKPSSLEGNWQPNLSFRGIMGFSEYFCWSDGIRADPEA